MFTYLDQIYTTIDSKRRELINTKLKAAKGEVSEMYYEGMRVALTEAQELVNKYIAIQNQGKKE